MVIDRYMKFVFTVIAVALTVLAVGQFKPDAAVAQQGAGPGWQFTNAVQGHIATVWLLSPSGQLLRCWANASLNVCTRPETGG
jgi:hypothetical protein